MARSVLRAYRRTLPGERRTLRPPGPQGRRGGERRSRAWIALLLGRDDDDPLFLQIKEAEASVLEPHLGPSRHANHGRRVVEEQRLMQSASDIFLGWFRTPGTLDGVPRDFDVRQLWVWKASADIEARPPGPIYAEMCGWTLARAHACSGDRIAIAAYLGAGDRFDRAVQAFAEAYADQNERDHRALAEAVQAGRVAATTGL